MAHRLAPNDGAYDIQVYEPGKPPKLPAGSGGIVLAAWYQGGVSDILPAAEIEVDDRPAFRGWGRAVIVVPAGERRVSLAGEDYGSAETSVTVAEGGLVELDFLPRRTPLGHSRFGPSPLRAPGTLFGLVLTAALVVVCVAGAVVAAVVAIVQAEGALWVPAVFGLGLGALACLGVRGNLGVRDRRLRQLQRLRWR